MNIPALFEDSDVLAVNKPAGITVNRSETTIHETTVQEYIEEMWGEEFKKTASVYLAQRRENSADNPYDPTSDFYSRAGIVHRLDKETSGVLLVAKNPMVFAALQKQFKERTIKKTYIALAHGRVAGIGEISVPVGRLPWNRNRFGILPGGRESKTEYKATGYYQYGKHEVLTLLTLYPQTGRTHQIRVHLKYIGNPIFSDFLYAGRKTARADRKLLPRVFLHAATLSFIHPTLLTNITVSSPLPEDLEKLVSSLPKID